MTYTVARAGCTSLVLIAGLIWFSAPARAQIVGATQLEGCSDAASDNIHDAIAIILDRLDDARYLACLRDAVVTETFGAMPEQVLNRLRDDMPTQITCKEIVCGDPNFLGCAGVTDGTEEFTIKTEHAETSPPASVASTIVHEVAHRKGFGHPGSSSRLDFPFTVPVQTAACIRNLAADGLDRSDARGDTELAPFGGTGGAPFERRCSTGRVVTGMQVASSGLVNSIVLHCEDADLARIGSSSDSTRRMDRRCADDQRVAGIRAQSDKIVSYLAMACVARSALVANATAPMLTWRYVGGEGGDPGGLRLCPTGMAMKGLRGRSGAKVDQLRVLCEDVDTLAQGPLNALALAGARVGATKAGHCLAHGVMTALYGHSGGSIDRLGGSCHPTRRGNPTLGTPEPIVNNADRHVFDWSGGNGGIPFALPCASGKVLVGLDMRVDQGVDAVRGKCAAPGAWLASGAAGGIENTQWAGRLTGPTRRRLCDQGMFLVGMQTWAQKTVHAEPTVQGVIPLCRRIDYALGFALD